MPNHLNYEINQSSEKVKKFVEDALQSDDLFDQKRNLIKACSDLMKDFYGYECYSLNSFLVTAVIDGNDGKFELNIADEEARESIIQGASFFDVAVEWIADEIENLDIAAFEYEDGMPRPCLLDFEKRCKVTVLYENGEDNEENPKSEDEASLQGIVGELVSAAIVRECLSRMQDEWDCEQ